MFQTIGFIGCGNMGGALARSVAKSFDGSILVSDKDEAKAAALAAEIGAQAAGSKTLAACCDMIFLGVKPQVMAEMLAEIRPMLAARSGRFILVTMAAGLEMRTIRNMAGGDYPVIRIMPNLPVSVGEGMVLYAGSGVNAPEIDDFAALMRFAGRLASLDESLIDAGCALSGSGPAFVFMFLDALQKGGEAAGLSPEQAKELACQTVRGAAELYMQSSRSADELKVSVCSPGGTTIQGVHVLEDAGMQAAVSDAVAAAYKRALEMR